MQIKFLGATPEEDHIVEIPEGTKEVTIPAQPSVELKGTSAWPAALVFCTMMICVTALVWIFHG